MKLAQSALYRETSDFDEGIPSQFWRKLPRPALEILPDPTPWRDLAKLTAVNGFSPVPVLACKKQPRFPKWQKACAGHPDQNFINRHSQKYPTDSVGIACGTLRGPEGEGLGRLFAVDIDADDQAEAERLKDLALRTFGPTRFIRTRAGSPRLLLLYRSADRVRGRNLTGLQLLGSDQQFIALGIHPEGMPYKWPDASPATSPAAEVPLVPAEALIAFLRAMGIDPAPARPRDAVARSYVRPGARSADLAIIVAGGVGNLQWQYEGGRVVDGREKFLTWCLGLFDYKVDPAWRLFAQHAELGRPKGADLKRQWSVADAEAKAIARHRNETKRQAGKRDAGRPRHAIRESLTSEQAVILASAAAQAERDGRITPAGSKVSAAMLECAMGELGACTASLSTLVRTTGLCRSSVKRGRAELVDAGLWEGRDVTGKPAAYFPVVPNAGANNSVFGSQSIEKISGVPSPGQTSIGPKVSVGCGGVVQGCGGSAVPASDDALLSMLPLIGGSGTRPDRMQRSPRLIHSGFRPAPRSYIADLFGAPVIDLDDVRRGGRLRKETCKAISDGRRAANFTERELAEAIRISRPQLSNILAGRFGASLAVARRLARFIELEGFIGVA